MSSPRIIAGKAKGRRLKSVPGNTTRPITDRTKESLFNIIGSDIIDSSLLDLFAGTGSVGIEALSRDASHVCFIDNNRKAIKTIRSNLEITGFSIPRESPKIEVLQNDAFTYLKNIKGRNYDFIYVAPPQYKDMWIKALTLIDQNPEIMANICWVIVQIHPIEYCPIELKNLQLFDKRKYGSTVLDFYEYVREES